MGPNENIFSIHVQPPDFKPQSDFSADLSWLSLNSYPQIYRIHNNQVELWAGSKETGFQDGLQSEAHFNNPHDLAVARDGTLYVADTDNHAIRKISPTGQVSTLAGNGQAGDRDGPANLAQFNAPYKVLLGPCHQLYVFDQNGVRQISLPPDASSERWGEPVPLPTENTSKVD